MCVHCLALFALPHHTSVTFFLCLSMLNFGYVSKGANRNPEGFLLGNPPKSWLGLPPLDTIVRPKPYPNTPKKVANLTCPPPPPPKKRSRRRHHTPPPPTHHTPPPTKKTKNKKKIHPEPQTKKRRRRRRRRIKKKKRGESVPTSQLNTPYQPWLGFQRPGTG